MIEPKTVEPVPVLETLPAILEVRNLSATAAKRPVFRNLSFRITPKTVTGIVGPSGAGKSTLLRCINRLADLQPGLKLEGEVLFHGKNILGPETDPDWLRARIGILFQQPVVFPTTIIKNVLFGICRLRRLGRAERAALAERSLRDSALWGQVFHRLHESARTLSVGQQQRLCLARTLACNPEIILMDEPTSALDPDSTAAIEQLILDLRATRSVLIVTHNPAQAERLCDRIIRIG